MVSVASFVGVSVIICNRWYHCSNIRIFLVELRIYLWERFARFNPWKFLRAEQHRKRFLFDFLFNCIRFNPTNPFQLCSFVSIFSIPIIPKSKIPLSVSTFNFNNYFQIKKGSRNHTLMVYHVILNANNSNLHTIPFYSSSQTSQKLVTISLRSLLKSFASHVRFRQWHRPNL